MYGFFPSFWSLPTSFLSGAAAAASTGSINSVGNLGGFAGPYVVGYLSKQTNSFISGVLYLSYQRYCRRLCSSDLAAPETRPGSASSPC
jgi:nitrate/nitrite transporter NarK